MANYQSVSGYLTAELPNTSVLSAFSMYKVVSKKLWFVLDDQHCALVGSDSAGKINKDSIVVTIELHDATITMEATTDNTFTLNSCGKEYKFKASNHEAMMVWVQAIQALRCSHQKGSAHSHSHSHSPLRLTRSAEGLRKIVRSQSLAFGLKADVNRRLAAKNALGSDSIAECDEGDENAKSKNSREDVEGRMSTSAERLSNDRSVNFAMVDIAMRSGSNSLRPISLSLSASDSFATGVFSLSLRRGSNPSDSKSATPRVSETNESGDESPTSPSEHSIDYDAMVEGVSLPMKAKSRSESTNGAGDSEGNGAAETDSALNGTSRTNSSYEEMSNRLKSLQEKLDHRDTVIQSLTTQLEKREKDMIEMDERVHILEMQLKQYQEASQRASKQQAPRRFSLFGGASAAENDAKAQSSASEEQLIESCKILTNKNQFLNSEIKRLETLLEEQRNKSKQSDERLTEMNDELARAKLDHLRSLQCTLQCLVLNPRSCSVRDGEVAFDGIRSLFKAVDADLCELLESTRFRNPALPTIDALTTPNHFFVDKHGFKHCFCVDEVPNGEQGVDGKSTTLETYQTAMNRLELLVYVCSQLYFHHSDVLSSYGHLTGGDDLPRDDYWRKLFSEASPNTLKTALRQLVIDNAIPRRFRSELWRTLIRNAAPVNQKLKKLGPSFYPILAQQAQEDQQIFSNKYARQIAVDLLRTMPSNIHFENINADRIKMLSEVLLTFLRYNSTVGYYQGMNFIAANALLFLSKEDVFWLLVAITEHFFHREQFFPDLIGLQADQLVLKDLIEAKLPKLYAHCKQLEFDLEVVSFSWFATLFFNALRFETLLRIWDCFLVDGRKFLFRISLALLKLQEDLLLEQSDALSAWRSLKLANQTIVAVDQLITSAYHDFEPFPKRKYLDQKQAVYIEQLRRSLNLKISEKQEFIQMEAELRRAENRKAFARNRDIYYCSCPVTRNQTVWVSYGDSMASRIALIEVESEEVRELDGDFDAEVTAMCTVNARSSSIVLVALSNGRLCAFHHETKQRLWYIRVRDSILSCIVVYCDRLLSSSLPAVARVFCGTADGSLAVMEIFRFSSEPAVFYLNLCQSPVTALLHLPHLDMVVCASQHKLHTVGASSLDRRRLHELQMSAIDQSEQEQQLMLLQQSASGRSKLAHQRQHIAILQAIRDIGICVVRQCSSVLEFYRVAQPRVKAVSMPAAGLVGSNSRKSEVSFQPLFVYDICNDSMDSKSRHASGEANLRALHYRITTVLALDDILWVGSSAGETFVYETVVDQNQSAIESSYASLTICLRMKNKLSELPVIKFQPVYDEKFGGAESEGANKRVSVMSFSGCYGDSESVLLWSKADENESTIWTNRAVDFSKRKPLFPPAARAMQKLKLDLSEMTLSSMHQTLARDARDRSTDDSDSPRMKADWRRKSLF